MRPPRLKALLTGLIGVAVAVAAWIYLAPVAFGGSTTYVVTSGVSMQPRFHSGDLVLVRSQSSYRVGEIVAYHNTMLHTVVLHRIVGREGARYLFKGDNNDFVDADHPRSSQLIGALWLHFAGAGAVLRSLGSPLAAGGLVGAGTLLLLLGGSVTGRRRRRRRRSVTEVPRVAPQRTTRRRTPVNGLITAAVVALLPFAALAVPAFTRSSTVRVPVRVAYKQSGAFSYSATARPGPVYAGNRLRTGAPVFTRVVNTVEFRFAYAFTAAATHSLTGRIGLYAQLTSTSGWQQMLTLERPTAFRGDHAVAAATLDLRSLARLTAAVEQATSVTGQYTLTLIPRVSVAGAIGEAPLHASYAPTLPFAVSEFELQRAGPAASGTFGAPAATTPFDPSASSSVTDARLSTRLLPLAFASVSVPAARRVAIVGMALVLIALMVALILARRRQPDEAARIQARYGHAIVAVARVKRRRRLALVDVADMAALAQIAERYDRLILHEKNAEGEAFWVADESAQYRFLIAASTPPRMHSRSTDRHAFRRWRLGGGARSRASAHLTSRG